MAAYTEEEAGSKWCPFSRVALTSPARNPMPDTIEKVQTPAQASFNRGGVPNAARPGVPAAAMCIGSRCMLWNWQDNAMRLTADGARRQAQGHFPGPESTEPNPNRRGYCGLSRSV